MYSPRHGRTVEGFTRPALASRTMDGADRFMFWAVVLVFLLIAVGLAVALLS